MNWGYYLTGFGLGTIKFLFSHWTIKGAATYNQTDLNFFEIFLPPTLGALITMVICYFASEALMERAMQKKIANNRADIVAGIVGKQKKKFTLVNKSIVQIKMKLGLYGITFLAPLFLSIPIGSVVCAKFYRHKKHTFILMLITVIGYSLLMSTIITLLS